MKTLITKQDLIQLIRSIVNEFWENNKKVLLLSALPKKLNNSNNETIDYKSIIGDHESLKDFLRSTSSASNGYRVVEHPQKIAKVGLIPFSIEKYTFDDENKYPNLTKSDIETFFKVLENLPSDTRKNLNIPADIVIQLFNIIQ